MVQWRSSESQNSSLKNSTLASLLLHTDTLDHSFSCCMVEIHVKIPLRFLTIFKQSHFNFLTLSLASSRSHSLTGINYLVEIKIWRPHVSQFFSILLLFQMLWLPYCSVKNSIFIFANSPSRWFSNLWSI